MTDLAPYLIGAGATLVAGLLAAVAYVGSVLVRRPPPAPPSMGEVLDAVTEADTRRAERIEEEQAEAEAEIAAATEPGELEELWRKKGRGG